MTPDIITQLNQLNQDFYQKVAPDFDDSRQYFWAGWNELIPMISSLVSDQPLRVLDLGSGNSRFLDFLHYHFPQQTIEYVAVDSNDFLLAKGAHKTYLAHIKTHHLKLDIIKTLASKSFINEVTNVHGDNFDLIVSFGFLHHIPSFKLRQQFINNLAHLTNPRHSVMIVTAWQFADDTQQQQKIVDPHLVQLNPSDLEPNDYILSWKRGGTAYRYCHHVDITEIETFHSQLPDYRFSTFKADGPSGHLNQYLVWHQSKE